METLQDLLPFERQMLLAETYHYAWYNQDAYNELKQFLNKWESQVGKPILFIQKTNENEPTNNGA